MAGWEEGSKWLLEMMRLDTDVLEESDRNEVIDGMQDVDE